jgi:hypothetical protein
MSKSPSYVTIYDLLHGLPEAEILEACKARDPKHAHRYRKMIAELKALPAKRTGMTVVIQFRRDGGPVDSDDPEFQEAIDVSGEIPGEPCPPWLNPDKPHKWAIQFSPWEEWLGASFRVEGIDLSPVQLLAECLNEMTYGGWTDEERGERWEDLMERAARARDQ